MMTACGRVLAALIVTPLLATACERGHTVIGGRLIGHDGQPMARAFAEIMTDRETGPPEFLEGDHFVLSVDRPGGYVLDFEGVHHHPLVLPLLVEAPGRIELEVRLSPRRHNGPIERAEVRGRFGTSGDDDSPVPMLRRLDGKFAATIDAPGETLAYQLFMASTSESSLVEGLQADDYEYENPRYRLGNFRALVRTRGRPVTIELDPETLKGIEASAEVRFKDPECRAARIASIYLEGNASPPGPSDELEGIEAERDRVVRQFRLLRYFDVRDHSGFTAAAGVDPGLGPAVLQEVPTDSPLWSLLNWHGHVYALFEKVARVVDRPDRAEQYARDVAGRHPDRTIRAAFLFHLLIRASEMGRVEEAREISQRLSNDFGTTFYAREARRTYAPDRRIMSGKSLPAFRVASLDDPGKRIGSDTIKGKTTLIDLWGTWCTSCIMDMDMLHRLYQRYRSRNFTILSLAYDRDRERVIRFREKEWPMPWLHGFILMSAEGNEVESLLEVPYYPTYILVDANGTIIAAKEQLEEGRLERTLERVLGK